jgi:hypothetical protein
MDDEEETYDTVEEAIAVALSELDPDGVLSIHADDCEIVDEEDQCTCTPLVLTRGAQA